MSMPPRQPGRLQALKQRVGVARMLARHELAKTPWRIDAWLHARRRASAYTMLTEADLRATRRSDTIFIFGSGSSINDLTATDVEHLERHDTLGFNWFPHERRIRVDYHLIREVVDLPHRTAWVHEASPLFDLIRENPGYRDTVYLVQRGLRALDGNLALAHRMLPAGARIFRWRSVQHRTRLGTSFADGLTHAHGTLAETVNFAVIVGWRRIVLVGVDLYDRRYFWLEQHEERPRVTHGGSTVDDVHNTAVDGGVVELLADWGDRLRANGVELSVYNPRSLLAGRLPVYSGAELS